MIRNFKFDYDSDNDSLFLYDPKSKSKASIEMDDLIIDFNSKKEVSAIELLSASVFFKNLGQDEISITRKSLANIKECKLEIITRSNFFVIKFMLVFASNEVFSTPLVVPTLREPSPALSAS